ncbi:MAG: hypothetical protein NZ929_00250 [Aigarchaeota archaeon]|nr:hypothetical protein [Aigarchaeota archaeon]
MKKPIMAPTGLEVLDEIIGGFPRGGLITLAGNPGTGKSAFAATLIYNGIVKYNEPGVYASFLEDEERFYEYMMNFGLDFKILEDRKMFKYLSIPTLLEPGMSMSAAEIIDAVESIGAKRLVIDSFTAMKQMFKSPSESRVFLHSLLSRLARQLDCTTILIKEVSRDESEYEYEDFISDGVIIFRRTKFEDKLVREMNIVKMRGTEVKEQSILFSLHKGFHLFKPIRISSTHLKKRYEPPPDPEEGYTSGIQDLDEEIGGFPKGSIVLFEIDPKLTIYERIQVTSCIYVSYLKKRRPVIWLPSVRISLPYIHDFHKLFNISSEIIDKYLIVLSDIEEKDTPSTYIQKIDLLDLGDFNEKIRNISDKFMRTIGTPPLIILGVDKLAYRFREEMLDAVYFVTNLTKSLGGLSVWIHEPIYPWIIERISPLADFHFKLTKTLSRTVFYGVKPVTPLYVVEPVDDERAVRLIPMV